MVIMVYYKHFLSGKVCKTTNVLKNLVHALCELYVNLESGHMGLQGGVQEVAQSYLLYDFKSTHLRLNNLQYRQGVVSKAS